ncbi:MAG: sugar transferase [Deltaproteobacteria bacterium]|nr:sugar transferase [Deltaproteobacteria bacterium]
MRLDRKEKTASMAACDVAALLIAFAFALAAGHRRDLSAGLYWNYGWSVLVLVVTVLGYFVVIDAYALRGHTAQRFLQQTLLVFLGLVFSGITSTLIFFFLRALVVPRGVFLLFLAGSFVLISLFRFINIKLFSAFTAWRVLFVGDMKASMEMAQVISGKEYLRYHIAGYLSDDKVAVSRPGMPFLGRVSAVSRVVENEDIDQVIVTIRKIDKELIKLLLECMQRKVEVSDLKKVTEEITGKVPIEYLDEYWFIMELLILNKKYFWYAKRTIDLIISAIGIAVTLPLLPLAALAIKLDSPGPVFYSQTRVGRGGKPFRVWKLRTMVRDADKNNVHWTTANDSRVTRMGSFLRKVRVDEFPQFLNILKGEMTLIGPRPEAASLVELYTREIPFYAERHMVTPGATGWAQINYRYGNSIEDAREKLKYDLYYIKHRNLVLDLVILLKTIRTVATGRGAI